MWRKEYFGATLNHSLFVVLDVKKMNGAYVYTR